MTIVALLEKKTTSFNFEPVEPIQKVLHHSGKAEKPSKKFPTGVPQSRRVGQQYPEPGQQQRVQVHHERGHAQQGQIQQAPGRGLKGRDRSTGSGSGLGSDGPGAVRTAPEAQAQAGAGAGVWAGVGPCTRAQSRGTASPLLRTPAQGKGTASPTLMRTSAGQGWFSHPCVDQRCAEGRLPHPVHTSTGYMDRGRGRGWGRGSGSSRCIGTWRGGRGRGRGSGSGRGGGRNRGEQQAEAVYPTVHPPNISHCVRWSHVGQGCTRLLGLMCPCPTALLMSWGSAALLKPRCNPHATLFPSGNAVALRGPFMRIWQCFAKWNVLWNPICCARECAFLCKIIVAKSPKK